MFSKILIANRGEIAVRIIRACREMGISTVAVYSQADKDALHVSIADESYCIGGPQVGDSYLNMAAILTVAVISGAQAIHPGYGLLSENAKFVSLCEKCNIEFIGPSSEMISKLGDKDEARRTMRNAGVPVTPGTDIIEDVNIAKEKAAEIVVFVLYITRTNLKTLSTRHQQRLKVLLVMVLFILKSTSSLLSILKCSYFVISLAM